MNNDSKLPWGIALLIVGIMLLFRKMNIFSTAIDNLIFDWRNLIILLGIVFLVSNKKRQLSGTILIAIGLLFYARDWNIWQKLSYFIWPLILTFTGGVLIYAFIINNNKQNNSELPIKKDENHQTSSSTTDIKEKTE